MKTTATNDRMRALVTGATSGIGKAIATELASKGYDLILVARDGERLTEISTELGSQGAATETLAADLSDDAGLAVVEERLTRTDSPVEVLVHCAGGGLPPGGFLGNLASTSADMTFLHVNAQMRLAHAVIPEMIKRKRGRILIVSSIAAFAPGSPAVTYAAAKAWQSTFGEGLHELLRGTGCTSTVVAPGFVHSEFHARSGASTSGLPEVLWTTPDVVARAGVAAMEKGSPLVIPTFAWRALYGVFALLPRRCARAAFARLMKRSTRSSERRSIEKA